LAVETLEGRLCPSLYLLVSSFYGNDVQRFDGVTGAFIDEFIPPGSGGLNGAHKVGLGSDGNLLVSSSDGHAVLNYDSATGAFLGQFVTTGSGGINRPHTWDFGPDSNLYVSDAVGGGAIYRYDGTTGAFIDVFVPGGSGGLDTPAGIVFGPDGNLYVNDYGGSSVMRYDGATGDPLPAPGQTGAFFVSSGLQMPNLGTTFGADDNLYVGNFGGNSVNRYDGTTAEPLPADGQTGAYFVPPGSGGLSSAHGIAFGLDGNLYVSSEATNQVLGYDGTTGAFLGVFATRMGYGGTAGLFFWDTGTRGTASISNRSHVTPEGAGNQTIFSSVTVQVVGAGARPQAAFETSLASTAAASPVSIPPTLVAVETPSGHTSQAEANAVPLSILMTRHARDGYFGGWADPVADVLALNLFNLMEDLIHETTYLRLRGLGTAHGPFGAGAGPVQVHHGRRARRGGHVCDSDQYLRPDRRTVLCCRQVPRFPSGRGWQLYHTRRARRDRYCRLWDRRRRPGRWRLH
jgi:streptogramin lyase